MSNAPCPTLYWAGTRFQKAGPLHDSENPFATPAADAQAESSIHPLWRKCLHFLFPTLVSRKRLFLAGTPIIHYGVVFFVDPADKDALHAALPLPQVTPELIARNVGEAKRVFPEFFSANPLLHKILAGRRLVIRLVVSYDDLCSEVCDRIVTDIVA